MENQINDTIHQPAKEDSSPQTNRVFTDAYALQIAEQVLTNIERTQLKAPQKSYEVKKISALLAEYKAGQNDDSGETLQTEFKVLQELHFWRSTLARRDEMVKAFHLRRFYDENAASVNAQTLAALGCFYRSLMPSYEVRSKYDFVVTQLFSAKLPDKPRYVRVSSEELIERLQRFNIVWTGIEIDWADEKTRRAREEAIAVFEALRAEIAEFTCLEDLLKSNFFNRVRRHKQYLGETFFAPEVTASSIQCNVAVGNKFSQLVAEENESFREALESEHGGVDVLNLVLEENPAHSLDLLKQIKPEIQFAAEDSEIGAPEVSKENPVPAKNAEANFENKEPKDSGEAAIPDVCAQISEAQAGPSSDDSGFAEFPKAEDISGDDNRSLEILCEKFELRRDVSSDFLQILSEISKREPAENVLRKYLASSSTPEVASFDFSIYLSDVEDAEQNEIDLKRRALRLIFVAENYQRRLQTDSESAPAAEEIKSLKNEIQTVINDLREKGGKLIGGNRKERGNILLTAVNDLFQARLRLISASSTAFHSQNGAVNGHVPSAENAKKNPHHKEPPAKPKAAEPKQEELHRANRGLIALTILVALFGLVYFVFPSEGTTSEMQSNIETAGVKKVNLTSLRSGDRLVVARISNNTLIGVVGEEWKNEAVENKRAILQSLLGQGTELQYRTVLLLDSKGAIVGNATGREIIAK